MKLLFYIIIGYIIYIVVKKILVSTHGHGPARWEGGKAGKGEASEPGDLEAGETILDPVCGTYVAKEIAIKATHKGKTHYFCGEECRDKFTSEGGG